MRRIQKTFENWARFDTMTAKISVWKVVRDSKGEIINSTLYLECSVPVEKEKDMNHILDIAKQLYQGSFPKPDYEVSIMRIFHEVDNMNINY